MGHQGFRSLFRNGLRWATRRREGNNSLCAGASTVRRGTALTRSATPVSLLVIRRTLTLTITFRASAVPRAGAAQVAQHSPVAARTDITVATCPMLRRGAAYTGTVGCVTNRPQEATLNTQRDGTECAARIAVVVRVAHAQPRGAGAMT